MPASVSRVGPNSRGVRNELEPPASRWIIRCYTKINSVTPRTPRHTRCPAPIHHCRYPPAHRRRYTSHDSMPKRRPRPPARPIPIQLPLFVEAASLVRIRPERNEFRYYRVEVWPDPFGRALLVRHWGRGTRHRQQDVG
jgi:hypothetical protein